MASLLGRTQRVAELRSYRKPATLSSALGRTRTCDLLIRRPNRAVLYGSPKCAKGAILLIGGDKTDRWSEFYEGMIPVADDLYEEHLDELREEGKIP